MDDADPGPEPDDAGIYARESAYLDRYVQVGVAGDRVLAVSFPKTPEEEATGEHPLLDRIDAYLEGEPETFEDVRVALTLPTDQRAVLEQAREIPHGDQVSVDRLARMTPSPSADDEADSGLVRTALDANPAPLLVPDHRVRGGPSAALPEVEQRLRSLEGL
jgi:methylated-DNA-[protein]-cysteine S-methyltransferase